MKPEIKEGQVWYDDDLNDLVLIYNETQIALYETNECRIDRSIGKLKMITWVIRSEISYYNFKDDNWHYVGEL